MKAGLVVDQTNSPKISIENLPKYKKQLLQTVVEEPLVHIVFESFGVYCKLVQGKQTEGDYKRWKYLMPRLTKINY